MYYVSDNKVLSCFRVSKSDLSVGSSYYTCRNIETGVLERIRLDVIFDNLDYFYGVFRESPEYYIVCNYTEKTFKLSQLLEFSGYYMTYHIFRSQTPLQISLSDCDFNRQYVLYSNSAVSSFGISYSTVAQYIYVAITSGATDLFKVDGNILTIYCKSQTYMDNTGKVFPCECVVAVEYEIDVAKFTKLYYF